MSNTSKKETAVKVSDRKGKAALYLLADLLEPVAEITSDKEFAVLARDKEVKNKKIKLIKLALKKYPDEVIEILAAIDGKTVDEYECNVFSVPTAFLKILNDKVLLDFFSSALQEITDTHSGSATENTEASGK